MMVRWLFLIVSLTFTQAFGEEEKLPLKVAEDGYPTGNATPEGAACELVRAFIESDVALLEKACLSRYGTGEIGARYEAFLKKIIAATREENAKGEPHGRGPKKIGKVFAARHLSRNGPGSYGYAVHGFDEVMFVDIEAFLRDGSRFLNRTMVVRRGEAWYVHPCPTIDPLLSSGLNEEEDSTRDFTEKYRIPDRKREVPDPESEKEEP